MNWVNLVKVGFAGEDIVEIKQNESGEVIFVIKEKEGSIKEVNLSTYSTYGEKKCFVINYETPK